MLSLALNSRWDIKHGSFKFIEKKSLGERIELFLYLKAAKIPGI